MMRLVCIVAVLALAACGVDGAPEPPATPGVSITGEVAVGMSGRL